MPGCHGPIGSGMDDAVRRKETVCDDGDKNSESNIGSFVYFFKIVAIVCVT